MYINSDNGTLYALRANDGSKIWQAYFGSGTDHADTSPAVADGVVYVGARNGYYAFNASDGSQIWVFNSPYSARQLTGYVYSSPAVADGVVYFGFCDGYTFGVNASTGQMLWSYKTGIFVFSSPSIAGGTLYVGSYDGYIYALGGASTAAPLSEPTTSPTQSPTPTSTSTAAPTLSPASTATPSPTQTTQPTPKPTHTPKIHSSLSNSISDSDESEYVEASQNLDINWIIMAAIVVVVSVALVSLMVAFRKN